MDPFNKKESAGQGMFSAVTVAPTVSYRRLAVLLLLMGIICFLLLEGWLGGIPGIYFWFIGGDLMELWFVVLVVLGFMYRGALLGGRKGRSQTRSRQRAGVFGASAAADQFFSPERPGSDWSMSESPGRGRLSQVLLRVPLVILLGFLVYYFFIQGYAVRMQPHLTVSGDCNGGTMTVQANTTQDTVFLKAGLLTIEGYGNLDGANNILNVSGNLCGFTLSVPAETNLHLSGNDATLSVTGITGKLELDDNAGDIIINDSTLLAGSDISNNAGNTTITHSVIGPNTTISSNDSPIHLVSSTINGSTLESGQFQIENSTLMGALQLDGSIKLLGVMTLSNATITTSGDLTLSNSRVQGSTKIIGDASTIAYTGTLAAGSSLTIVNISGTETVTLPSDLAFHLDASGVASFSSNDSTLQGLDPKALASSDGAHVDVGTHPQAIVAVQGQGDTLTLNRGGA